MKCIKKNPAITYAMLILVFSVVYNFAWKINPDSFIKNNSLNSTPVQDAINLAFPYNEVKDESPNSISSETFNKQVSELTKKFYEIRFHKLELEEKISHQNKKLKEIDGRLSSSRSENINKYMEEKSRKLQNALILKNNERAAILFLKNRENVKITLANKDVEIAEINLELATIEFDARVYIFSHLGDFNDQNIVNELNITNKEIDDTRETLIDDERKIIELRNNVHSMLQNLKKDDLNFFDFLFYSIGISTTTTFGDLLANSRYIRMIVCVQLLLSILVLANVTQNFLSKNKRGD